MMLPEHIQHIIRMQEEAARIHHLLNPPSLDMWKQMVRQSELIRRDVESAMMTERMRSKSITELAASHKALLESTIHRLPDIEELNGLSGKMHQTWLQHSKWLEHAKSIEDTAVSLHAAMEPVLSDTMRYVMAAEKQFAEINSNVLRQKHILLDSEILQTQRTLSNLARSYESLTEPIKALTDLIELPDYMLPSATREVFMTGYAIRRLGHADSEESEEETSLVEDAKQKVSHFLELLKKVNPAFERLYVGARYGIMSGSPDRARHVFVSLRELWSHLLRELAPDEKVIKWLPVNNGEYLYDGKPTRRGRILYICRGINHDSLADFLDKDTKAFIEYFDIFQRIHELDSGISDEQLKTLMLRTDSWLMYILNINEETE